jgi:hypothetical protein
MFNIPKLKGIMGSKLEELSDYHRALLREIPMEERGELWFAFSPEDPIEQIEAEIEREYERHFPPQLHLLADIDGNEWEG